MLSGLNRQGQVVFSHRSITVWFHHFIKKKATDQIKLVEMKKTENKTNNQ